ncbi:unnamed protein product [Caenorhabditis bovis]|uniref:Glutathione-dependent dehydroascorbate reductase n=1 Tax=Caenorhabditis bovis TaxID=2654633 RepID=A0A8S1ERQ9_9PELO|nr:unnamed protein product [Caenorhabditis bovis]
MLCRSSVVHRSIRSLMSLQGKDSRVLKKGDAEPTPPAPGTFRIYNMRFCPWAQRTLIYAAAKKIPAEIVNIHLQEKPEWYFKKHYKGQVPALEHDGKYIIESAIIPEYLDDLLPNTRILPTDPYEKVQQKLLIQRLGDVPQSFYGLVAAIKDPSVKQGKLEAIEKAVTDAENLLTSEYYSGSSPGFVDYLFYPNLQRIFWISHFAETPFDPKNFPGTKFPKLTAWYAKVEKLPEVVEGSQPTELGVEFIKGYVKGDVDYDFGLH